MAYDVEDEVDWSDGPLGPASPDSPSRLNPILEEANNLEPLFMPENGDHYALPVGTPLPFSKHFTQHISI
jgi:hypothetical protein